MFLLETRESVSYQRLLAASCSIRNPGDGLPGSRSPSTTYWLLASASHLTPGVFKCKMGEIIVTCLIKWLVVGRMKWVKVTEVLRTECDARRSKFWSSF